MLPGQPLDKSCEPCATCDWWLVEGACMKRQTPRPLWAAAGAMLYPGTQVSSADMNDMHHPILFTPLCRRLSLLPVAVRRDV